MLRKCLFATLMTAIAITSTAFAVPQTKKIDIRIRVEDDDKKVKPSGKKPFTGKRASVDVAILLDTSNSMDGLISQAKSQLWNIVQQFAEAKKSGQTPILRVSVFEYGNTRLPASEGYIRQVVGLTDDLDKVSEALFSLRTSGGDEYCGQVIHEAVKRLDWSKETNGYKAIFVCGNEPFTQGPVHYKDACKKAIEAGIIVNTIHCGNRQAGINGKWAHGAKIAEGEFLNINQDRKIRYIKCPQDKIIIELNAKLNKTYLWYGKESERRKYSANQVRQDLNAQNENDVQLIQRNKAKISSVYRNVGRCLCDSYAEDKNILKKIKADELPENMRKMTMQQRQQYLDKIVTERNKIRSQLAKLQRERDAHVRKQLSKTAKPGDKTLGDAFYQSVQKQLKASGFQTQDKK